MAPNGTPTTMAELASLIAFAKEEDRRRILEQLAISLHLPLWRLELGLELARRGRAWGDHNAAALERIREEIAHERQLPARQRELDAGRSWPTPRRVALGDGAYVTTWSPHE